MRLGASVDVQVEHHDIRVPVALGEANVLRLAFAADFHAGPTTSERLLRRAAEALRALEADVLLLGGDFVSLRPEYAGRITDLLRTIPAPLGRYAVLGNHDYWAGASVVAQHLAGAGVQLLTNRNVRLPQPFQQVFLCGLDDHTSGEPDPAAAFARADGVRVLLMHSPSGLLDVGDRPFTVALSGHTHGGQIALSNGRPLIVAHGRLSRRHNAGRYDLEQGRTLLVSRGIGCSTLPVRVNSPASILLCTLWGGPQ
jgi:predicted MPP superfamily phosphohydrolase